MTTIAQNSTPSSEKAFLWCGALSVLLHLGFLSLLPISETPKPSTNLVKVRLIEAPAEPARDLVIHSLSQLTPIWVRQPLPLHKKSTPTLPHQTLRDHHAENTLTLKSLLKVAQRTQPPSNRQPRGRESLSNKNHLYIERFSIIAIKPQNHINHHQATTPLSRSIQYPTLTAHPPSGRRVSKSKVTLERPIRPIYPAIARRLGWEGTVKLRVVVQPDGLPSSIKIKKSSGHPMLDTSAAEAMKKWRFVPAKDGNIPIQSTVEIPIRFDLPNKIDSSNKETD